MEDKEGEYQDIFENKVVLITGGTGFLGRALIAEILKYNPQSIRIFSRDEVKHHKTQEQFKNNRKLRSLIGDVRDSPRLVRAMEGVNIIIHAAALKRLDILEYNVSESIQTNILGTLNVVNACLQNNVEKAIFISSDKACSPVNTYGACKFVGEKIFTESNYSKGKKKTVFASVRYGNVLESTGSVIPFFISKLQEEENIPLTDPQMTRFIISPLQAVELVFKTLKYCVGGEIFVPQLPSFRIVDLIEILKEKHKKSNEVKIIGVRPGEKIHEQMINETEITRTYRFQNMFVIRPALIEKYTYGADLQPTYLNEKNKLTKTEMREYNSEDNVISKEKVHELFQEFGLL